MEATTLANRGKSEFLANMSHELRTPLNAIIGFSEVIKGETMGPIANDRYKSYATDIHQSGSHLLQLINDILDLFKIEAGMMELHTELIDLESTIESCLRIVGERAKDRRISIATDCDALLPPIVADERKIKQVLLNLLSNAVKFTPEGGEIAVAVSPGHEGVTIEVRDSGIGMRAEDIPIALAPFGQVDSRLNRKYEGTGLGLPFARRLIELHGGELSIASSLGQGTVVTIKLPESKLAA